MMEAGLNASQWGALVRRLLPITPRVGGVRGPPGTGKTTTLIVEVVKAAMDLGESVFVAAGQNATADQTLLGIHTLLTEKGWPSYMIKRVGNISKSPEWVKKMFYAATYDEAKKARIVVSTFHSSYVNTGFQVLRPEEFDRQIFDETGQATPEQAWIPLVLLNRSPDSKVSVYGDDKQLLPFSPDWIKELGILGHLSQKNPSAVVQLDTGYRENDGCIDMTSSIFYGGSLNSPPEIRARRLAFNHSPTGPYRRILDSETPLTYLGVNCQEEYVGNSIRNVGQARAVRDVVRELIGLGIEPARIMCMAIYRPQVRAIDAALAGTGVQCSTVHRKLGAENHIAVVSATRANPTRTMGIASYKELWNVATSRQSLKLILVGDSGTTFSEGTPVTRQMFDFIQRKGQVDHISF